jgi:hypothetical protein
MPDNEPTEQWNLTDFLTSMGMSKEEAEAWIKARKKGRSFKTGPSDAIGEQLDKILERNMKVIYTVDTILAKNVLANSYSASSMNRFV